MYKLRGKEQMLEWTGNSIFQSIFIQYLTTKYKSDCSFSERVYVKIDAVIIDVQQIVKSFVDCINKKTTTPIFMFISLRGHNVHGHNVHHSNIIIYRPLTKTLEHFEPTGYNSTYDDRLKKIMIIIKDHIQKEVGPIELLHPIDICPSGIGIQSLECRSLIQKKTKKYCLAWNLFFIELVLSNPTIPSKQLLHDILTINDFDHKYKTHDSFSYIINGYVYLLYDKFLKYVTYKGKKLTALEFLELMKDPVAEKQFEEHIKYDFNDITPIFLKETKGERCKKGTRRNKVTGNCEPVGTKRTAIPTKTPIESQIATPIKRCPNGTRRNKVTKKCEQK
jgi:hypothetical protein